MNTRIFALGAEHLLCAEDGLYHNKGHQHGRNTSHPEKIKKSLVEFIHPASQPQEDRQSQHQQDDTCHGHALERLQPLAWYQAIACVATVITKRTGCVVYEFHIAPVSYFFSLLYFVTLVHFRRSLMLFHYYTIPCIPYYTNFCTKKQHTQQKKSVDKNRSKPYSKNRKRKTPVSITGWLFALTPQYALAVEPLKGYSVLPAKVPGVH